MVLVSDGAWCSYAASRVVSHARACARVLPLPPLRLGTAEAQRPTRRPRRRGPCTGLHERASPCASRPVRSPTPRAARGRNADRVGRWLCPHGPPVRQGSGEPRPRWGWRLPDGAVRRRARPRTVRTPGVVGGGPARLEPPAAVARRNLGACGRPRAAGRNGLRNGARRAARGHAHPTGGGCTIAVHTPSRGAQPAPRGTHGVIPAPHSVQPRRAPALAAHLACPEALHTPRHQHNARHLLARAAPLRINSAEKTYTDNPQQISGPATRLRAGATGECGVPAPAGPGTPAALATRRAPRCGLAQWWTGARISSGPASG
jgi:hypothetical protein